MIGLVLVMHGDLAQAFRQALEHVVGPQEQIACLTVTPTDTVDHRLPDIRCAVDDVNSGDGVIVVTDVFGGTPCNIATALLKSSDLHVVAGANLPMLIKLARVRRGAALDEVVVQARRAGRIHYYCAPGDQPSEMEAGLWIGTPRGLTAEVIISNPKGLHARPSAKFVKLAEKFDAEIRVSRNGETVGGTSIMGLLMLGAAQGASITISATGREAEAAMAALVDLVRAGFYDDISDDEKALPLASGGADNP